MMKLFTKIVVFKNKLTKLNDDEPVTKLALAIIIILDIFILNIIFAGLDDHTNQLTSPNDYFPYQCKQVYIQNNWSQANKIEKLQHMVLTDYNNWSYRHDSPFQKHKIEKMHPACKNFYNKVKAIADDKELHSLFVERQNVTRKKRELVRKHDRENEVYDTSLLENIADKDGENMDSMSKSVKARARSVDNFEAKKRDIDTQISNHPKVKPFWELIAIGDRDLRKKLINDVNKHKKYYLLKELMWQLIFLLPLLVIFFMWHTKSVSKERRIQSLISAHLIVVAFIPIVFKILHVVLELVPYHFFKDLFKVLERLHIVALWHYGVILASIGAALLAVYIIQKKIFNKERLYEKRMIKGQCYSCGKLLPDKKAAACPFCGTKQIKKCSKCSSNMPVNASFCTECGEQQSC